MVQEGTNYQEVVKVSDAQFLVVSIAIALITFIVLMLAMLLHVAMSL